MSASIEAISGVNAPVACVTISKEQLASLVLPSDSAIVRQAIRPLPLRQPGFDEAFDSYTLFYDCFWMPDGNSIRLIAPNLLNLELAVRAGSVSFNGAEGVALGECITPLRKLHRLDVPLPAGVETVAFSLGALGDYNLAPAEGMTDLFAGRRVLFTLFKYEPLSWIRDWIEFNVRYHGVDAVLLYQNAAPRCSNSDIAAMVDSVPGIEAAAVVEWDFPYGPPSYNGSNWDSNFCQFGVFEHARARFLSDAAGVLNTDIDELVVTAGHRSIFDMAAEADEGYLRLPGAWVRGYSDADTALPPEARRHRDFDITGGDASADTFEGKWVMVPSRCPDAVQWVVHTLINRERPHVPYETAGVRHFRAINTNWKKDRSGTLLDERPDAALIEAYRRVGWRD